MRTRFGAVLAATGAMACAQPASAAVVVDVDNYAEFPAAMVVGAS